MGCLEQYMSRLAEAYTLACKFMRCYRIRPYVPSSYCSGVGTVAAMAATLFCGSFFFSTIAI